MTYGLLTKCEVKLAGYWPSSFFASLWIACIADETKPGLVSSATQASLWTTRKKRTRPIPCHLDRANLVNKGFILWLSGKFCLRDTAVVPSGQDGSILPAWVANHSARLGSSCPHIIKHGTEHRLFTFALNFKSIIFYYLHG